MSQSELSSARSVLGQVFVTFCRKPNQEFLLRAFASDLLPVCPGLSAHDIYRWGGAHEENLYFTDNREANPQRYWRIDFHGYNFLFPRPVNSRKFEDGNRPKGFYLPQDEIAPQLLRKFFPAIIIRNGFRWELQEFGEIHTHLVPALIQVPSLLPATDGLASTQDEEPRKVA